MAEPRVEQVFKLSGVPTYTFVEPSQFDMLAVALRSEGRGVVLEGPSGIGKSTAVSGALQAIGSESRTTTLSARNPQDLDYIALLPELGDFGTVIIDDFHRLPELLRQDISDLLKILADTEDPNRKVVAVGINEAGTSLIEYSPDLATRIEVIRLEVEPPGSIERLIEKGEEALNITFDNRQGIVDEARGSFYIAQVLCFEMCVTAGVLDRQDQSTVVNTPIATVKRKVMERQEAKFGQTLRQFARGPKFRPRGRGAYLHILRWLADAETWSINLKDEIAQHPNERISVGQVVDKGWLKKLTEFEKISAILHFDDVTKVLSVEDPHLVFYLRNLDWAKFVKDVGFLNIEYDKPYDVALSFAGEDRNYATLLHDALTDDGWAVFYDEAEQARILTQDVEEVLGPIYESGARWVVAIMGEKYGVKRWTIFEASRFKDRIDAGEVVAIWSTDVPASAFDATRSIGHLMFDPAGDLITQASASAESISQMIAQRDEQRLFPPEGFSPPS